MAISLRCFSFVPISIISDTKESQITWVQILGARGARAVNDVRCGELLLVCR